MDIKRDIIADIRRDLEHFPVLGILGPRQCGKTTLVQQLIQDFPNSLYLDLESPSDLNKLQNPEYFFELNKDKLICLDEVQRIPEIFPILRSVVDRTKRKIRVIILGSASPDLLRQSSESLAGRIVYHYLTPFTYKELFIHNKNNKNKINVKDNNTSVLIIEPISTENHWLKGGFPLSVLREENISFTWRRSFIKSILERDLPQVGLQIPFTIMNRFFQMLSHSSGNVINKSKLAGSLGISHTTISHYLDILEKTFYIRILPPFFENTKKRLVKSPKVYIRDTGILHSLLDIKSMDDLLGHPIVGMSWEGYLLENTISLYPNHTPYFYRTSNGAEIDLILLNGKEKIAFEFKFSNTPKPSPGFYQTIEELNLTKAYIICPIQESYSIHPKVIVTNLENLCISEKKLPKSITSKV
jgi:uncharacterized protein